MDAASATIHRTSDSSRSFNSDLWFLVPNSIYFQQAAAAADAELKEDVENPGLLFTPVLVIWKLPHLSDATGPPATRVAVRV